MIKDKSNKKLVKEYTKSNNISGATSKDYYSWLEDMLIKARKQIDSLNYEVLDLINELEEFANDKQIRS